jgi:hypothetical protein
VVRTRLEGETIGQTSFSRAEAQSKVGTRVRACVAFGEVPRGAIGTITGTDPVIDGYDVEVAWGRAGRRMSWVDWLTKPEYEGHRRSRG